MRREGRGTIQDPLVLKLQISSRTSVPLQTKPDRVGRNILAAMVNFWPGYINTHDIGRPNKSARFKVCAIVVLLGWQHWKFNTCHLVLLWLLVMECYTKEQRVIIVKTHYKYGESYVETVCKLHGTFGQRNAPSVNS